MQMFSVHLKHTLSTIKRYGKANQANHLMNNGRMAKNNKQQR